MCTVMSLLAFCMLCLLCLHAVVSHPPTHVLHPLGLLGLRLGLMQLENQWWHWAPILLPELAGVCVPAATL
jgi:hypothetical protein